MSVEPVHGTAPGPEGSRRGAEPWTWAGNLDAPVVRDEKAPRTLGFTGALGLWGNLGVSLLLPVAAPFVVLAGRPFGVTFAAIVVGAVIGSVLLGLGAAAGARQGVPAMVLLRGLLGVRLSYLPTAFNLVQCIGWATFEIVIIAEAAAQALDAPRWPFVLAGGVLATLMAVRPLGAVRVLSRYAVWAALLALAYLFWRVLAEPRSTVDSGGATSFWTAVDVVIALPVSWFPLAADYTRHVRTSRGAFAGAALGYGAATVAMFTLGVLAVAAYGTDVIGGLLAVPFGLAAVLILVAVELDEAFANIYSTAMSAQNLDPLSKVDRRWLAIGVGVAATVLALTFDIAAYEPFLFLIGAVFVPLVGVFAVRYLTSRNWDLSTKERPWLLGPWVAGFVAYQLTTPTYFAGPGAWWTAWWAERQADLGIDPANGLSASLVSLAVAAGLTALGRAVRPALAGRRGGG